MYWLLTGSFRTLFTCSMQVRIGGARRGEGRRLATINTKSNSTTTGRLFHPHSPVAWLRIPLLRCRAQPRGRSIQRLSYFLGVDRSPPKPGPFSVKGGNLSFGPLRFLHSAVNGGRIRLVSARSRRIHRPPALGCLLIRLRAIILLVSP